MLFKLRTQHVIGGAVRPPGTILVPYDTKVPDDLPGPVVVFDGHPTPDMEGVDDEGKAKINEIYNALHGTDAPWHSKDKRVNPDVERPYAADDHMDNQEVNAEEQVKRNEEMAAQSAKFHGSTATQTLPVPGAQTTAVRPSEIMTPPQPPVNPPASLPSTRDIVPPPPSRPTPRSTGKDE